MSDMVTTWFNAAGRYPVLSHEETIYVARRIQEAPEGSKERIKWVNKLCLHNLRFAAKTTRAYMMGGRTLDWSSDKTADFLQVAYMGLRRAAEKFDPSLGYTFTTYANAWIRQALGRYHVENMSLVHVPDSSAREFFYLERHGRPRNESVAKWVHQAHEAAKQAYGLISYDSLIEGDTDGEMSLLDVLSDENRLGRTEEKYRFFSRLDAAGIMSSLGIEPWVQDMVMEYAKRGNLDTVLMRHKRCTKENRQKVRAAIVKIQEATGATR